MKHPFVLFTLLLIVSPLSAQGAAPAGRVKALAHLERVLPAWRANLPASRPRALFTPEQ
jgi:hypothetical protein